MVSLFIPNRLYMFRVTSSPIIRSTRLYLQLMILLAGGVMDEMELRHPKHVVEIGNK